MSRYAVDVMPAIPQDASTQVFRLHERLRQVLAFCILGSFFLLPSSAAATTVLVIACTVLVAFNAQARSRFAALFVNEQTRWLAWPFLIWLLAASVAALFSPLPIYRVLPDNPLRFVLALSLLALVVHRPLDPRWLLWSLPFSAIVAGAHAVYSLYGESLWRVRGWTNSEIYFGNISGLVCALLLVVGLMGHNLRWQTRVFFITCCIPSAFAAIASGSRSSALALLTVIPFMAVRHKDLLHKLGSILVASTLGISVALLAASPALQQKLRIAELAGDLQQVHVNHYDTSIGARIEMWRAAWDMFQQHPVAGIGPKRFAAELDERMQSGAIARIPPFSQAHSQILHSAATAGVIGVLAYLILVIGPAVFFFRQFKASASDPTRHMLAAMGLIVIASHVMFGLTNAVFDLQVYSVIYSTLLCMCAQLLLQPPDNDSRVAA